MKGHFVSKELFLKQEDLFLTADIPFVRAVAGAHRLLLCNSHPRVCRGEKAKSNVSRDCSHPLFTRGSATMAAAAAQPSPRSPSNYRHRAPAPGTRLRSAPQPGPGSPENNGRGLPGFVALQPRQHPAQLLPIWGLETPLLLFSCFSLQKE